MFMRPTTSENIVRCCRQVILMAIVSLMGFSDIVAQNVTLRPPQVARGSSDESTFMFRSSDVVTIRWEESLSGLEFKIGTVPGVYGLKTIRMRGERNSSFTPEVVGLPVGVYYGILTDSDADSYTEIQIDASTNSGIHYSREFKFAIESETTPRPIAPRGSISERVPTFEWEAIPGVVAYALIVSNSPFTVTADNGQISAVEGLNPVWIHLTSETSALYGERAQANPLIQFAASPLVPGQTYYYTILNAYSKTDPAFLSVVLGPVISFSLVDRGTLDKPLLTFPVGAEVIVDEDEIIFEWDNVSGALSYDVSIFERIRDDGATSDLQVYSANTPNSSLNVRAFEFFREGEFRWFVIANDREGAASVSSFASFYYRTEMGDFTFETRSSKDAEELLGVTVRVVSTDGGYNPPNPFVNISSVSFSDSLVVGDYEFTASKDGFDDVTVPVQIRNTERARVLLNLDPLPSRISGQVVDADNIPVSDAVVRFDNVVSTQSFEASTNNEGIFSRDLPAGTYRISVSKSGFRSPADITVSVSDDQLLTLPDPLVVIDDEVSLSGRVTNQDGIPVAQARVRASIGTTTYETVTDGNGAWDLNLSEGEWTITASKEGFLAPLPLVLSLFAGDAHSNINFVLVQQASRIEGLVQGRRILPDGRQEIVPIEGATVVAYPLAGEGIETTTDNQGRFLLDLGTGSYSVFAVKEGFALNRSFELILEPNQTFRDVGFLLDQLSVTLFGSVVDESGIGIESAEVISSSGSSTLTSAGGAFTLLVAAEQQTITARYEGRIPAKKLSLSPAPNSQWQGIGLVLYPNAASIAGTVRSAAGVLAGVELVAEDGNDFYTETSGPDGSYSFDLPGGMWEIRTLSSRYRQAQELVQVIRSGQHAESIDIWMERNFVLMEGFISTPGSAASGLMVEYSDVDESLGSPLTLSTISRGDGFYALYLGARTRFEMQIEEVGFQSFSHSFTTDLPDLNLELDVHLLPSEALLSGKVEDVGGFAISDVRVEARVGGIPAFSTTTDGDGQFQLSIEAGSYDLTAIAVGYHSAEVSLSVTAGQRVDGLDLTLASNRGSLFATILNPVGGVPIQGAVIDVRGEIIRSGVSNDIGNVSLSNLPAGIYEVDVIADGFLFVTREITIEEATTSRQTFILVPSTGSISGEVRSEPGAAPLEGATMRLVGAGLDLTTTTDPAGRFEFSALPDGGFIIEAQVIGHVTPAPSTVTISAAARTIVLPSIHLSRATARITGQVTDLETANALNQVVITATSSSGTISTISSVTGEFELSGLEAGSWSVRGSKDGYRTAPLQVAVLDGQTSSIPIVMQPNQAALLGRIRAANGDALPFDVSVQVITTSETQQVFTTAEGSFVFEELPGGELVVLKTLIQREGYVDIENEIELGVGNFVTNVGDVAITVRSAEISGSVGVGGARIQIADAASSATVAVVSSSSSGSYEVVNLAPGSYLVQPSLPGFTFSPAVRSLTLAHLEVGNASFSATSSVGLVQVLVVGRTGQAMPDIPVRITSFDRAFDEIFITDSNGLILPSQIPLGHHYRIEPLSGNYLFDPVFREIDLVTQSESSVSFILIEINSFITGSTQDELGALIDGVRVIARRTVSEQFEVVSDAGLFAFGPIPSGTYQITAHKEGFNDVSTSATVGENASLDNLILTLDRQSVTIQGLVIKAGLPVAGQEVTLTGPTATTTLTNEDGIFRFVDVPVDVNGFTQAEISIERSGRPNLTRSISYSIADVGQILELEDLVLASAKLSISVSDGTRPLENILLSLEGPGGRILHEASNATGIAETQNDLDTGDYIIGLVDSDRLSPVLNDRIVSVPDDNAHVVAQLLLPFLHAPPLVVRSDDDLELRVTFESGSNLGLTDGYLYLKLDGQVAFSQSRLSFSDGEFSAVVPSIGERPFEYFIQLIDGLGDVRYESTTIAISPVVAGRLQSIVLSPDPHDSIIRTGEDHTIHLGVRDGLGQDLSSEVISAGVVSWSAAGGILRIEPDQRDGQLSATIRADVAGDFVLTVSVRLGTEILESTSIFRAGSSSLQDLQITAPDVRMQNDNDVLRLAVSGIAEDGTRVLMGNSVTWSLLPSVAGHIDDRGTIRTDEERFIGPITAVASDNVTGLRDTVTVAIFAGLDGLRNRSLTDFAGTQIDLSAASIPFRSELGLTYPRQPTPRRFDSGGGDSIALTAGENLVRFNLRSDRSLLGDSLEVPATISLPADPSLRLYEGEESVGYFDSDELSWKVLPSIASEVAVVTGNAVKLGDYSVVSSSKTLDIRHLAALPTPFSPEIAPLKIGYFLDTSSPPATVRIDIVNTRGELVRTLLSGEPQWSGRYGSRTGLREILWDGLTEDGKKARNGRYIIRIEAKDLTGTVSKMLPVVLVK